MKKPEAPAFGEFMTREAQRYARDIVAAEIATWFETFKRTPLDEFKLAWEQHRKDAKRGVYFPTINDLMRLLRVAGDDAVARDWRCCAEVNSERCGYPGGINAGHGPQCSAHYRLSSSAHYSDEASLQIIEASRAYTQPKNAMEHMERGSAQRAIEGERWRKAHAKEITAVQPRRHEADAIAPSTPAKPSSDEPPEDDAPPQTEYLEPVVESFAP